MADFWDTLADNPPKGDGPLEGEDNLPDKMWALGETCQEVNDGGWAPKIQVVPPKGERTETLYQFRLGLNTRGGEPEIAGDPQKYRFTRTPFSAWVHDRDNKNDLNGRLKGFINAVLATGEHLDVEDRAQRAALRWRKSIAVLREAANRHQLSPEQYGGDGPRFVTGCLVALLDESPRLLMFKTKHRSYTNKEGAKVTSCEAGTFEDVTQATMSKRNVSAFAEGGGGQPDVPSF